MYQRILVPLDGSPYSREILSYAVSLASVHDTELVFLRVIDKTPDAPDARSYVERLAGAYGATALCVPRLDPAADHIIREARRVPNTLVAMTSRGHSGLAEITLGSVAQQVLRGMHEPVLLYHPTGAEKTASVAGKLRRIVLPVANVQPRGAMAADAARFARWVGANLEVVSVVEASDAAIRGEVDSGDLSVLESAHPRLVAQTLEKEYGIEVSWETLHGRPADAISEYVANQPGTMLAMMTRRTGVLQAALFGTVAGACLRHAGVPILVRTP